MVKKHWKYDQAVEYLDNVMPESQRDEFEAHLASGCAMCWGRLDRVRGTIEDLASAQEVNVPSRTVAAAVGLFAEQKVEISKTALVATLVELETPADVFRGDVNEQEYVYTADEMVVRIRVEQENDRTRVLRDGRMNLVLAVIGFNFD